LHAAQHDIAHRERRRIDRRQVQSWPDSIFPFIELPRGRRQRRSAIDIAEDDMEEKRLASSGSEAGRGHEFNSVAINFRRAQLT